MEKAAPTFSNEQGKTEGHGRKGNEDSSEINNKLVKPSMYPKSH